MYIGLRVCTVSMQLSSHEFLFNWVRSGAQSGPGRDLYNFLSPQEPLWHHCCFWCVLWLFEAVFGICSWETNGYLPPGKISIPAIQLLFDGILSGAANHPQSLLWLTPPLVSPLLCEPSLSHPSLSERFTKSTDWLPTCLYQFLHPLQQNGWLRVNNIEWCIVCYPCPELSDWFHPSAFKYVNWYLVK